MDDRTLLITRLRFIANWIETLPEDCPTPTIDEDGARVGFDVWWRDAGDKDLAATMLRRARQVGGVFRKNDPEKSLFEKNYYTLTRSIGDPELGITVRILGTRDGVCTPVVVGHKTVHVAAQPAIEAHDEEQPIIEYECKPLNDVVVEEVSA